MWKSRQKGQRRNLRSALADLQSGLDDGPLIVVEGKIKARGQEEEKKRKKSSLLPSSPFITSLLPSILSSSSPASLPPPSVSPERALVSQESVRSAIGVARQKKKKKDGFGKSGVRGEREDSSSRTTEGEEDEGHDDEGEEGDEESRSSRRHLVPRAIREKAEMPVVKAFKKKDLRGGKIALTRITQIMGRRVRLLDPIEEEKQLRMELEQAPSASPSYPVDPDAWKAEARAAMRLVQLLTLQGREEEADGMRLRYANLCRQATRDA